MTPKRCAWLTMECTDGWAIDADLGFGPMKELGWEVEAVPWRSAASNWNDYEAVYVGAPWDYPQDPERFLSVLELIDRSDAVLVNDLSLIRWSLPKTYLRDLESRGAEIVPSWWLENLDLEKIDAAFVHWQTELIIMKPVISTNATDTYLLTRAELAARAAMLSAVYENRPFVVQPFISSIVEEGEFSMFYFNNEFSHAIRKTPKRGDFRVQEEYGAQIVAVQPEALLQNAADGVMALVEPVPAYARADFVRARDGRFLVMELELVEPSMYLRMDDDAPRRFAEAFDRYVAKAAGGRLQ